MSSGSRRSAPGVRSAKARADTAIDPNSSGWRPYSWAYRWAIAAFIRALQFSQRATVGDVPPDRRAELDAPTPAEAP